MVIALAIIFTSIGCKKDNNTPTNQNGSSCANGTLYFQNTQTDPYKIYIDGVLLGTLAAGATSSSFSVSPNLTHTFRALQASGYVIYPTDITGTGTCTCNTTITWKF